MCGNILDLTAQGPVRLAVSPSPIFFLFPFADVTAGPQCATLRPGRVGKQR